MRDATREKLLRIIGEEDLVLDIGGWADPFWRADWVLDLFPYETRGLYERRGWVEERDEKERFSAETWITRDICDHEPFPFEDDSVDFVICSQTLEDIRDPIWVCREMSRIGRAGYVEVPSRLEEQSWGVIGEYVGWSHHRWLIDEVEGGFEFVPKPHSIHGMEQCYFPRDFWLGLSEEEKNLEFEWERSFTATERIFFEQSGETLEQYMSALVERETAARGFVAPKGPLHRRVRERASKALGARAR